MSTQLAYWIAGGAAVLIMVAAGIAEHRRARRHNLDQTGWVPWRGIQVAAAFGVALAVILATHR